MKKIVIAGSTLIILISAIVVMKNRKGPMNDSSVHFDQRAVAIDEYLARNPSEPAAPQLQRLSAAMKARPAVQQSVVGDVVARSLQDDAVSPEEASVLSEAAALAEQDPMTASQVIEFSAKLPPALSSQAADTGSNDVSTINHYIQTKPSGRGVAPLKRLVEAQKKRPASTQVLTKAAAQSVEDGSVSSKEERMLKEAAVLAEKEPFTEQEAKAFTARYPIAQASQPTRGQTASSAASAKKIDTYLEKHSSGRGVEPLRRLSKAMKARPGQAHVIGETAARSIEDGAVSKEEAEMLEEAAALAEDEGLTAREMAEFSEKYSRGAGSSYKAESARISNDVEARQLASFEGQRQLIYTFTGSAQCEGKPCKDIRVSVRVSCGSWVESREGGLDPQGRYELELPVMSGMNEKVAWQLKAWSSDLRKAENNGQRFTSVSDKDIKIQNALTLRPG